MTQTPSSSLHGTLHGTVHARPSHQVFPGPSSNFARTDLPRCVPAKDITDIITLLRGACTSSQAQKCPVAKTLETFISGLLGNILVRSD
mmetsp:Transcript_32318/g.59647  ORF Transcript_32318/g.59647 Transcript_32318/m.59647 type:complete len:89 (+) Transcript_32318:8-274(+)